MAFEGPKDLAHKIMEDLDDRSLLEYCLVNKHTNRACADQEFWHRRFLKKYGEMAAQYSSSQNSGHGVYKPEGRSWKNHYLQVVIDLDMFSENPEKFLKYIGWNRRGIEHSTYMTVGPDNRTIHTPLIQAPEWVLNNLYLLDMGRGFVNGEMMEHVTPFIMFQSEARYMEDGSSVNGFAYARHPQLWRMPHYVYNEPMPIDQ